jgi:glycosyltransferase involved in cell wall biosynthesis
MHHCVHPKMNRMAGENVVSIIIPVYNGEEFLRQCLDSVVNQSFQDLEIIIIDDGSKDSSCTICSEYASRDNRIRLVQQQNAGVSVARNNALSMAKGEYITFVDSDDVLTANAIEVMHKAMTPDVDYVIGSHTCIWRVGKREYVRRAGLYDLETIRTNISEMDEWLYAPWGKLFRREVIEEHALRFTAGLPLGEDHIFNLQYCKRARSTAVLSNLVYFYRKGGPATTVKYYPNRHEISLAILDAYWDFFDGIEYVPLGFKKQLIRDHLLGCVEHYLGHCRRQDAISKVEDVLSIFKKYISREYIDLEYFSAGYVDAILNKDAKRLSVAHARKKIIRILYKKMKKLYYKFFKWRI